MELYNFLASTTALGDPHKRKHKDFPFSFEYAWVLGNRYISWHDLEELRKVIRSKLWFTYRNNFSPIGGTGPCTDKHWGCMLRCGQMVMAEALICKHLGRGWMWNSIVPDPVYMKILRMFQDKKDSTYSIHQIAQMGVSEGKAIGEWFGPNTVAQVLRKLSVYDEWSSIAVHIALDNTVIESDIRTLCNHIPEPLMSSPVPHSSQSIWYAENNAQSCTRHRFPVPSHSSSPTWRPMLLFIPLRLGLASLNPIYIRGLKSTFTMKQSLGIIGGKPKHAVWFVGCVGNDLVCLDPHTTQPTVNLEGETFDDSSFHVSYAGSKRLPIKDIDPSIALCFFFESESDFIDWCGKVQKLLVLSEKQPLFELLANRPEHWPPLELRPDLNCSTCSSGDYSFLEQENNSELSDEDFEPLFTPIFTNNKT